MHRRPLSVQLFFVCVRFSDWKDVKKKMHIQGTQLEQSPDYLEQETNLQTHLNLIQKAHTCTKSAQFIFSLTFWFNIYNNNLH